MSVAVLALCPYIKTQLDLALADARAQTRSKQRVFIGGRLPQWQIGFYGKARLQAQWHLPLLIAFALHAHPACFQLHIVDVQSAQLRQAQAAAIQQFKHGLVAYGHGIVFVRAVAEPLIQRLSRHGFGQAGVGFGRFQADAQIAFPAVVLAQKQGILLPHTGFAPQAARIEAFLAQAHQYMAQMHGA